MKSSYSCSVMMMMMESWSRAVKVFLIPKSLRRGCSCLFEEKFKRVLIPPSVFLHHHLFHVFDFEVRYESPIPGMMIPVARAHLMMMAAFAVAFC